MKGVKFIIHTIDSMCYERHKDANNITRTLLPKEA